jgi:hypothetical protein
MSEAIDFVLMVKDGVLAIWAYWPWVVAAIAIVGATSLLYRAYRVGGWPGLTAAVGALAGLLGYVAGRTHSKPDKPVPTPQPVKKKRKTILDLLK